MFSSFPYFVPKLFCFLVIQLLVCCQALTHYLQVESFPLFWNFLFGQYFFLSCLDIFLVFLLSPVPSSLISSSCIVCLTCVAFFSFRPNIFLCSSSVLSFLLVVEDFLLAFPVEFPLQVLSFCSCYLEEHRFFHKLI